VSSTAVLFIYAVGASLVAFWAVARYPALGPQTFRPALFAAVAAFALQSQLPAFVVFAIRSLGVAATLVFVVLPSLVVLFWTSGCLVRSLIAMITPYRR
jgi:hypothetical protein